MNEPVHVGREDKQVKQHYYANHHRNYHTLVVCYHAHWSFAVWLVWRYGWYCNLLRQWGYKILDTEEGGTWEEKWGVGEGE